MIRYLYRSQLDDFPTLSASMYRHRATQFQARLGWDVTVDENGFEKDEYDALNPLYLIWERPDGTHGGSMRLLPTTGATMTNDHFLHVTGGRIESPLIWECTRFCLAPDAQPGIAAALMLAGGEVLSGFGIAHYLGVFDARMVRIYRLIGASPEILGSAGAGRDKVSVGLWEYSENAHRRVAQSAGLSPELSRHWFERAFGNARLPGARQVA